MNVDDKSLYNLELYHRLICQHLLLNEACIYAIMTKVSS